MCGAVIPSLENLSNGVRASYENQTRFKLKLEISRGATLIETICRQVEQYESSILIGCANVFLS